MKNIIALLLVILISSQARSQTVAEQLSSKIADKMKDTLELTGTQRQQIYEINMQLATQKQAARAASTDREVVGRQLQQIEGTRDGLYQPILGEEKFATYRRKKNNLVNNQ